MDDYSVCRPFVPLRRYSVKDSGIRLNRYLFCDSRSCPNNQSCRNIQQGKTLRFRCPLQSAPVRTEGFFLPRNGCNIAPGTDPAMETVTEDFQNFSQRFSGADFCCRQTTASCTFVCRKTFRHTKGARSARPGGVPESRHLTTYDLTSSKRGSDARQRQIPESTGIISNSPRKRISALSRCFVRQDWNITAAGLS